MIKFQGENNNKKAFHTIEILREIRYDMIKYFSANPDKLLSLLKSFCKEVSSGDVPVKIRKKITTINRD